MKLKACPKCGLENLGDKWCYDRKLKQYCKDEDCFWEGEPRIPEKCRIVNTKKLIVDDFSGWNYTVYDEYGHVRIISKSYDRKEKAINEIKKDLIQNKGDTAVLFKTPSAIRILFQPN